MYVNSYSAMNVIIQLYYSASHSLLNEATVLTCCVHTANHTTSNYMFPYVTMDSFVRSSGNQSFNETNMLLATREPCIFCLVEAPFYLVVLVFILTIWYLVVAAKDLTLVIVRFAVANILIANLTAVLRTLVIVLARSIVTIEFAILSLSRLMQISHCFYLSWWHQ